jgi:hypothetical protein
MNLATCLAIGFVTLPLANAPAGLMKAPAKLPVVVFQVSGGEVAFSVQIQGCEYHGTAPKVSTSEGGKRLTIQGTESTPAVLWVEPAQPNQGRTMNKGRVIVLTLADGSYTVIGSIP